MVLDVTRRVKEDGKIHHILKNRESCHLEQKE